MFGLYHNEVVNKTYVRAKYALIAVAIHAVVLVLPVSQKAFKGIEDTPIDVTIIKPEEVAFFGSPKTDALKASARKLISSLVTRTTVREARVPAPKQQREKGGERKEPGPSGEGKAANAGNITEKDIVSQASPGPGQGEGVAVGLKVTEGKASLGSGGTGEGTGRGGSGGGTGTGSQGTGSGGGGIVNAGFGRADGPQFLRKVQPEYPEIAKRRRKEGKVVILVTIDENGRLTKAEIIEATDETFARSAVEALNRSAFLPAKRKGVAVACRAKVPMRFSLEQ